MAETVIPLVSTGATLPVGTGVVFDSVAIGLSTGNVEYVKLMSGSSGSTVTVPASSAPIGAVGLHVSVTNSSGQPIGVVLTGGQSSVSVVGPVAVTDNAGSITVDVSNANSSINAVLSSAGMGGTTASPMWTQPVLAGVPVSTSAPLPVKVENALGSTVAMPISGNTTAAVTLSTASITRVDTIAAFPANSSNVVISGNSTAALSTVGMGGSTANAVYVNPYGGPLSNSTFKTAKITSTALTTLLSSAAGAIGRINITSIHVNNTIGVACAITLGTATNALVWQTALATGAGGWISMDFPTPIRMSSGLPLVCETVPASTVFVSVTAFRSN